jgi:molybdopterin converting factor small subunit
MKVRVKFYADLRDKYSPKREDGILELRLKDHSQIEDVFDQLEIDDREIGFILLNERKVQKSASLSENDFIQIFSFVTGG